jgi:hypothetical protein
VAGAMSHAQHCAQRDHLNDDLHIVTLSQELIVSPPVELWPKVIRRLSMPADVEEALLSKLDQSRYPFVVNRRAKMEPIGAPDPMPIDTGNSGHQAFGQIYLSLALN